MGEGGAHLEIGAGLFERAAGTRPTVEQMKDFIERCPPFRALLVALCFSQYDRCIREERQQSLGRAGRNDMFSAVYLAYCKVFVTDDDGHCKAMKVVADLTGLDTTVLTYQEFNQDWSGFGRMSSGFTNSRGETRSICAPLAFIYPVAVAGEFLSTAWRSSALLVFKLSIQPAVRVLARLPSPFSVGRFCAGGALLGLVPSRISSPAFRPASAL